MTPRRNIAILTMSGGHGDLRAAEVIQRAIQDGEGNFDIRILDALELSRGWFRRFYASRLARWWSACRGAALKLARRAERRPVTWLPLWAVRRACREAFRRLRESPPHLVIATGTDASRLAALAKNDGWIACPVVAVQTQLDIESGDERAEVDVFAVANESSRADLISQGVSPHRVVLCGFPIDPAFSLTFDIEDLMPALGLDPRRPVVLVMGSEEALAILTQLERCAFALQVVVVAGRDEETKSQIEAMRGRVALDFQVFGWTDMVPELMAAADLMITRPTALPTAEALTRGLPMLLTPGRSAAEERLSTELLKADAARRALKVDEISLLVDRLLGERDELAHMGHAARELGRPAAAHAIAQMAIALLDTSSYIDFLAAPPSRPGESAYLM